MYRGSARNGFDARLLNPIRDTTIRRNLKGHPPGTKVFCGSLMDFYWEEAPDELRNKAYGLIKAHPQYFFQVLTKRPHLINSMLPTDGDFLKEYKHVWLGTSAENQKRYDERIHELVSVPAKTRFISAEPLLEPINLRLDEDGIRGEVHWVIVGGESGNDHGAYRYRTCELSWIEDIISQCKRAGVPVFVKQTGTYLKKQLGLLTKDGIELSEWPQSIQVQEFPERTIGIDCERVNLSESHSDRLNMYKHPNAQYTLAPFDVEMDNLATLATRMFFKRISNCLVAVASEKSEELVHLSTLTMISALFPSVRLLDAHEQKKSVNLFMGVVGPPASGKRLAMAPIVLLDGVKDFIENLVTSAGERKNFPKRTVVLPGNITKSRLIDHLWVNSATDTPTLVAESETSTLLSALSNMHGNFYDILNKIGENEFISYSRKKDNETVFVDYPMASILLTGTLDQAVKMYETPGGTFSRFLYHVMHGSDSFKPMERFTGEVNGTEECASLLSEEVKKLFLFYRNADVLLVPDEDTLAAYNAFGEGKYEVFKETLGKDSAFGFRYIFRVLKIAGIYALIRTWLESGTSKYVGDGTVSITMDDLQYALDLEPNLWYSHTKVYQLVSSRKINPYAKVVGAMKSTFTRQEFITEYGLQNGGVIPSDRNATRVLTQLQKESVIERVKNGVFKKL